MTPVPHIRWQQRLVNFSRTVEPIQQSYLPALERLHAFLQQEVWG